MGKLKPNIKMKYLTIFYILFCITICSIASKPTVNTILDDMTDKSQKEIFKTFHYLHLKEYELNSEVGLQKYKTFKENMNWIEEQNSAMGKTVYGITEFTDMTQEEFAAKHLASPEHMQAGIEQMTSKSLRFLHEEDHHDDHHHDHHDDHHDDHFNPKPDPAPHHGGHHVPKPDDTKVNEEIEGSDDDDHNLRDTANVSWKKWDSPIKTQLTCGSCWAFSTIGAIENRYHQLKGKLVEFSEQYLIDCDTKDNGCRGGWPTNAMNWIKGNGLIKLDLLKYTAKTGQCELNMKNHEYKILKGYKTYLHKFPENSDAKTWESLQQQGPIIVALDAAFKGFQLYRPTKFEPIESKDPKECKTLTHAVVVVGTVNENGKDFIIAKNSWGQTWGYDGYFKMPKDNSCLMLDFAFLPEVYDGYAPPAHPKPEPVATDCVELYGWNGFAGKPEAKVCDSEGQFKFGAFYGVKFPEKIASKTPLSLRLFKALNCYGQNLSITESSEYPKAAGQIAYSFSLAYMKPAKDGCANFFKDVCLKDAPVFEICSSIPDTSVMNLDELAETMSVIADSENTKRISFYTQNNYKGTPLVMNIGEPVFNIWSDYKIKYYMKWKILKSIKLHRD